MSPPIEVMIGVGAIRSTVTVLALVVVVTGPVEPPPDTVVSEKLNVPSVAGTSAVTVTVAVQVTGPVPVQVGVTLCPPILTV